MQEWGEEKLLKIEAEAVLKEIEFAVEKVSISEKLPRSDDCIFLNLCSREKKKYCIELTVSGFRVRPFPLMRLNLAAFLLLLALLTNLYDRLVPTVLDWFGSSSGNCNIRYAVT